MNMKNFIFIWILFSSVCFAQDRPVMHFDKDNELVKDLLSRLENAMNNNNFREYIACFTKELASKNKKNDSIMFVEHKLSLEFNNFQILESNDQEIEFVVKYTTCYSGENVVTIANILGKKENENILLVANQEILSQKGESNRTVRFQAEAGVDANPNAPNHVILPELDCANGVCKIKRPVAKIEEKDRKTFSLFNDANGNPDPNGIMWLDPRTLMEVYPERYECIGCR